MAALTRPALLVVPTPLPLTVFTQLLNVLERRRDVLS